jgi:hypothetical protein
MKGIARIIRGASLFAIFAVVALGTAERGAAASLLLECPSECHNRIIVGCGSCEIIDCSNICQGCPWDMKKGCGSECSGIWNWLFCEPNV